MGAYKSRRVRVTVDVGITGDGSYGAAVDTVTSAIIAGVNDAAADQAGHVPACKIVTGLGEPRIKEVSVVES